MNSESLAHTRQKDPMPHGGCSQGRHAEGKMFHGRSKSLKHVYFTAPFIGSPRRKLSPGLWIQTVVAFRVGVTAGEKHERTF